MAESGNLTIGKVVAKLKPTYPDLSVSKVRFLEDEGLLNPSRTPGGYRMYSPKDVDRLETILYLQKSKFLPLNVIKDELDGSVVKPSSVVTPSKIVAAEAEAQEEVAEREAQVEAVVTESKAKAPSPVKAEIDTTVYVDSKLVNELHPIDRMPQVAGVPISLVRKMADNGLIRLRKSPAGRDLVDGHDLHLIKVCSELGRFGIEPRNLRQYVSAANREVPLLEQALVSIPRQSGESDQDRMKRRADALERLLGLTGEVRESLLRRELTSGSINY